MEPPFSPILFEIGPLAVYWYGLLIAAGILLGARIATSLAREDNENPETIWDMLVVVVILALIGARAYHVFSSPSSGLLGWSYYKENPAQAFAIWNGGLGIYGALIGGALGVTIFCTRRGLNVLQWLDFLVPGVAFDRKGRRLGRGAGFYDRFLGAEGVGAFRCAVAFACQIMETVPTDAHDLPVDCVVTEREIIYT